MNEKVIKYTPIALFIVNTMIIAPIAFMVEQQHRVTMEYRERMQRQMEEQKQINYAFMRDYVSNDRFIAFQERIEQRLTGKP